MEFNIQLAGNQYTNFHMFISPIKITSAAGNDNDITAGYIPVNIFLLIGLKKLILKDMVTIFQYCL